MTFDISSSSLVHHDRIDGAVRALHAAGQLLALTDRLAAFDALEEAATLADSFGHPSLADIRILLATVA